MGREKHVQFIWAESVHSSRPTPEELNAAAAVKKRFSWQLNIVQIIPKEFEFEKIIKARQILDPLLLKYNTKEVLPWR